MIESTRNNLRRLIKQIQSIVDGKHEPQGNLLNVYHVDRRIPTRNSTAAVTAFDKVVIKYRSHWYGASCITSTRQAEMKSAGNTEKIHSQRGAVIAAD